MIPVLIADDQALVRGGFRIILDSHDDLTVVGEAEDGLEAVDLVIRLHPDVTLMHIRMPALDGIQATRRQTVRRQQLAAAVRDVAQGDALLAAAITRRLVEAEHWPPPGSRVAHDSQNSTQRELDVLKLVAQGLSNAEIATHLCVGESTAKAHVSRIFMKLHLRDRAHAVVLAHESGLIQPGDTPTAAPGTVHAPPPATVRPHRDHP
jgi:DNA-binding NarL/FixJ family response regulator